ncbi:MULTISPECIES: STAS domain-containing protein [Fulvivirga]|uniref:Anti-sigma factor antagonist n=1 Tax=Fulvivirga sediminis TaxID=2803949 RepID=A0A937F6P8_9BACT|nr:MULTISPECIES: STAS domain-containing protein [Fulvivirga]MBL3656026.1 STAS domain-containing protein [Fulvivirga sediminis]UII27060.1 STAS domain-containing protein [Fulvivirga maritima]
MNVSHELKDQVFILKLEGDLIGEDNGIGIMEIINDHIQNGVRLCMIDISELRYINSSGIGVLITILTKFRNKGGEVCLLKPSESVKKLLIITKLNAIFSIVDSQEEAFENLKSA